MSANTRSRRLVAAAALGVAALGGSLAVPAQAASAQGAPHGTLAVQAPATVGLAGQPVAFTETVTNTGTETTTYTLVLQTETEPGTPRQHAITIDYEDPANGTWKSVPLDFYDGETDVTYNGTINGITVAPGRSVKLDMRIGAPMGMPHDGAGNGGFRSITLGSRLTEPGSWPRLDERFAKIGVDSVSTSLAHLPATAVAGGEPIEFDAVLTNPTPSAYANLGNVLFTDPHATVQVRTADGRWTTLKKVSDADPDGKPGVYLQGRDSSIGAHKTTVTRVRVSYDATTPLGATKINPCVFVNESTPFHGTTMCAQGGTVTVIAPAKGSATPGTTGASGSGTKQGAGSTSGTAAGAAAKPATDTAPVAAPATDTAPVAPATAPAPTAPATPVAAELAATGSEAGTGVLPAALAAGLATLGAGAVLLGRRLRRRT
ncbi:hypothetical protein [Kitasatospora sp. NPDC051702]|uniref:hypothetical protein n=1 Tax=Kitasatospora sp. NPDC051702 TaxID=3155672 RepID=UPI0034451B27